MLLFQNLTMLLSWVELSNGTEQNFKEIFKKMCEAIAMEHSTQTFIYMRYNNNIPSIKNAADDNQILDVPSILQTLENIKDPIAIINIDANTPVVNYSLQFNLKLMSIVQMTQNATRDEEMLQLLWKHLRWNRESPVLLIFNKLANDVYVTRIFKYCVSEKVVNIIGLQAQMAVREQSYWALRLFPNQDIVRKTFPYHYRHLYIDQLKNMQLSPFHALAAISKPQMYSYKDKADTSVMFSGYLGRTFLEYTRRRNATLVYHMINERELIFSTNLHTIFETYNADVSLLRPISLQNSFVRSTVIVNYIENCVMIPVERFMHKFTYYYLMLHKSFVIIFCFTLVTISCICSLMYRWKGREHHVHFVYYSTIVYVIQMLLGTATWKQKFMAKAQKFISVITSFAGIIIGTAYVAFLQSFIIDAPTEEEAKTLSVLLSRGIQIPVNNITLPFIKNSTEFYNYTNVLTTFENQSDIIFLRDSLDTRYAYFVSDIWPIIEEQQKYFTKPLFRLSNICFKETFASYIPTPVNSIFYQNLNYFVLKLREAGLIDHWWRHSIVELLEMDVISLEDRNKQYGYKPLTLNDFQLILVGLCLLWALSFFCFVLEVLWKKFGKLST